MYQIEIAEHAFSEIKKLPQNIRKVIATKIELLKTFSLSTPNVKMLTGEYKGYFRLRSGDYRILFKVEQLRLVIIVVDIFSRGKGY